MNHFGEHLTIDGYDGDYDLLNDRELVLRALYDLPRIMGMSILAEPVVHFAPSNNKKDPGGWSGFVVICESHISIHTFPGTNFISADVYTCQNGLKVDLALSYFQETFKLQDLETNLIIRGTRYPEERLSFNQVKIASNS